MHEICFSDLKQFTNYTIIDIREKCDYDLGHIMGSIHIELTDLLLKPEKYLNKSRTYIICCEKGESSYKLCKILSKQYNVFSLKNGYDSYKKE